MQVGQLGVTTTYHHRETKVSSMVSGHRGMECSQTVEGRGVVGS